eukprot:5133066-Ditylum_brightwellii.AAC.1
MDDRHMFQTIIAQKIINNDVANHHWIKFFVKMSNGRLNEIIAYNELRNIVEQQHEEEIYSPEIVTWAFKDITGYQGPLQASNTWYKGFSCSMLDHSKDGPETYEPLVIMTKKEPIICAKYAHDNNLLDTPEWKFLKKLPLVQSSLPE